MSEKRGHRHTNKTEDDMAAAIDDLMEFEKFRSEIAPKLRALVEKGASAEDIYKFGESMVASKMLTIALRETDSGKAIAAIKDILDRTKGKAKERSEVEHKFSKLREEEIDALLESRLKEVADDEEDRSEH